MLLTIELGNKHPEKLQSAYPDIALFMLGKALSACLIFWVARGKAPLSHCIRVWKGIPRAPEWPKHTAGFAKWARMWDWGR